MRPIPQPRLTRTARAMRLAMSSTCARNEHSSALHRRSTFRPALAVGLRARRSRPNRSRHHANDRPAVSAVVCFDLRRGQLVPFLDRWHQPGQGVNMLPHCPLLFNQPPESWLLASHNLSTTTTLSKANSAAPIGMPSVEIVIEKLPASRR